MRKDCSTCKHDYDDDCYPVKPPCDNCVYCSHSAPTNWEPADYYKPDTNADRIRAMTDEELAKLLVNAVSIGCPFEMEWSCEKEKDGWDACDACWCKWLRQPVKED